MTQPFLGMIIQFGGNFAMRGYSTCSGQQMSIAQNSALFSILGTTYGGNGQTTFALPDLRGRTVLGTGQGPGLTNIDLGEAAGVENVTLLISNMPAHTHTFNGSSSTFSAGGGQPHASQNTPQAGSVLGHAVDIGTVPAAVPGIYCPSGTATPIALGGLNVAGNISVTGSSIPFAIRNPYLGITCLIALQGIFPSRN